jgi:hypothetical protein
MRYVKLSTPLIAIAIGILVLFLFRPLFATEPPQTNLNLVAQSTMKPTYRISDNVGIVLKSNERNLAKGFFVVRDGETWVRFEAENVPRTIPLQ